MGKKKKKKTEQTGTFATQPISQADARQPGSEVAMPNAENVTRNKNWVDQNKK